MSDDKSDVASYGEVVEAASTLTELDLLRLRRFGRWLLGRDTLRKIDAEDLFHEAIKRALAGTRKWRRGVPFVVFLKNAMKSVANAFRERKSSAFEELDRTPEDESDEGLLESSPSPDPGPEDSLLLNEEAQREREYEKHILALFEGKANAETVLMGLLDGMAAVEIQTAFGLSPTEYDSARKAIQRERPRIGRILRGGSER